MIKEERKGITLVALVITIIILLLLAGVSISSLTGSGLFDKAKQAKNKSKEVEELEEAILSEYDYEIERIRLEKELQKIKNVDTRDTDPVSALPMGTEEILEGNADNGIVIKDKNSNEWTWVEVPKSIFKISDKASDENKIEAIKADLINYLTSPVNYREYRENFNHYEDEWYALDGEKVVTATTQNLTDEQKKLNNGCGLTYDEYNKIYEKMLKSIYKYGGFWISRYEIGDSKATENNKTRTSGIVGIPVSQPNQIPYNYVTCSEAQILASGMTTDKNKVSNLLFGIQWELVCKFIDMKKGETITLSDGTLFGNYKNSVFSLNRGKYNINPVSSTSVWTNFDKDTENYVVSSNVSNFKNAQLLTTGASEQFNMINIYDLAGNESEWTLERGNYFTNLPMTRRGGMYNAEGAGGLISNAGFGAGEDDGLVGADVGFRVTLY